MSEANTQAKENKGETLVTILQSNDDISTKYSQVQKLLGNYNTLRTLISGRHTTSLDWNDKENAKQALEVAAKIYQEAPEGTANHGHAASMFHLIFDHSFPVIATTDMHMSNLADLWEKADNVLKSEIEYSIQEYCYFKFTWEPVIAQTVVNSLFNLVTIFVSQDRNIIDHSLLEAVTHNDRDCVSALLRTSSKIEPATLQSAKEKSNFDWTITDMLREYEQKIAGVAEHHSDHPEL